MKNNKGFTLVELIASFTLALTIMFFLLQIVIAVKELYVSSGLKTELLIKQANLERSIGTDFRDKVIETITSCGENCYTFTYQDQVSKTLKVDKPNKTITYGDYTIALLEGSTIGDLTINKQTIENVASGKKNTILTLDIPVTNKVLEKRNFGVHLIYQYDDRITAIGL